MKGFALTRWVTRTAVIAGLLILFALYPAGSAPQSAASPYVWNNVEIGGGGGFVDGIVFHPKEPDLIYARTDIGGVYRWDAGARKWTPLTDWVDQDNGNLRGAESIAVDPSDPNRVYVAAGTYRTSKPTAILRSDDQGRTWKQTLMPIAMGGNQDGRGIGERLAVDPNDGRIIYFGTRHDGLWRSEDYGANWSQLAAFPDVPDDPAIKPGEPWHPATSGGIGWVVFDPRSGSVGAPSRTIFAGLAVRGQNTIFRSTDAGVSWQPVPLQPANWIPHHAALDIMGNLYVSYSDVIGPNNASIGCVYKLDTRTGVWTDITPFKGSETGGPINFGGYGGLAIDSRRPGTVMVATLDRWHLGDDIFRSTDGGLHWNALAAHSSFDPATAPWLRTIQATPKVGWWMDALAIDPFHSGRVLYGTGATIWGTDDIIASDAGGPTHWKMYAEGIEETAATALVSPPVGAHLTSGLGDIGGFTHWSLSVSPPEGMSAHPVFASTSTIDFAAAMPGFLVRTGSGDDDTVSASRHGAYTRDGGHTWQPFPTEPAGSRGGGSVAVSADAANIIWAPEHAAVSYTTDFGVTWIACAGLPQPDPNAPATYFGQVDWDIASDRVAKKTFYAFNRNSGALYVSVDGGADFAASRGGAPAGNLAVSPLAQGDLWVAAHEKGLCHSTDAGRTWVPVAGVGYASSIGFGAPPPGASAPAIYMIGTPAGKGAIHGIYRSTDTGRTWLRINDDLHQYGWIDDEPITGDPRLFGRVYVGTNGRGVVYGDPAKR